MELQYKRKTPDWRFWVLGLLIIFGLVLNAGAEEKKPQVLHKPTTINLRNDFGLGAGVGFGSGNVPATQVSLKFWVNPLFGLQVIWGFLIDKTTQPVTISGNTYLVELENDEYTIGGRANFNVLRRDYLNFYTFLGGGGIILNSSDKYQTKSGFYINGGGGVEWFIPWIKRLGLDLEIGIGYRALGEDFSLGNLPNLMGLAGFHYYF